MKNYKILIVDDLIENLQIIYSIISEHLPEYVVLQTNNPENVVNIATKAQPHLIITDWDMPKLSGIELIKSLKENPDTKNIPIIMVTGIMLTNENLKIALDSGAIDYIRKPIAPIELIARINSAILLIDYYNQIVKQKDQELTENTMRLIKSTEFIESFANKLHDVKHLIKEQPELAIENITKLGHDILNKNKEDSWMRFELSFDRMHKDFSKNLVESCESITPTEIKLCSFVRLGMSNKEIAALLNQTPNSIKVSRYRIRKKLGLARGANFENYLSKF